MVRIVMAVAFLAWLFSATVSQASEFHRLVHNHRVIEYVLVLPDHFDRTAPYPVLLALPPGHQSKQLVEAGLHLYREAEAKKRGWVVISPAAPEGESFWIGLSRRQGSTQRQPRRECPKSLKGYGRSAKLD